MRRSLVLLVALVGCGTKVEPVPPPKEPAAAAKTYPITGEVRSIDLKENRLTLRHDEVAGYMPPMTMPFTVAKTEVETLKELQAGDKVKAILKVRGDSSELDKIEVTETAEPQAMTLDLSGKTPALRPKLEKLKPGEEVPDFTVTLQDGKTASLADFRGKVVALTFIYTRCPLPDFCPRMDAKFGELASAVGSVAKRAEEVRLLSVSFDPGHDTPEVLAKHARLKGAKPPLWQFAVASHEELAKVAERLGLAYGPKENEVIHNLTTAIIGPDGKLVALYGGNSWTTPEALSAIKGALPR